nr:EOG090X03P9 [Eulimnadia texana]
MANNIGSSIEDYDIFEQIGKGGFATVFRAVDRTTRRPVAVKMINKRLMQAAGMVSRVRQEVAIHSRLKHPSILELYTFLEDSDNVYLILELCENGELQRYLKSLGKPLSEDQAAREVLQQVVDGILYLHSHQILHRDLSLANLLLTKDMKVKIADFGLATQLTRPDEKHLTMCGTPNYISPEVATRSSHGLEADVWGLGCLLYTILVGKPPFDTDAVKSTLTKVVMGDFKLPSFLSPEAKDLINRLLQKNPKDRLPLVKVLDHPFMQSHRNSRSGRSHSDSGMFTMSTVHSGPPPIIKRQQQVLPKLRSSSCSRECHSSGPLIAQHSDCSRHSTKSLPVQQHAEVSSKTRHVQSWGELHTGPFLAASQSSHSNYFCSHHSACCPSCSHAELCQCRSKRSTSLQRANHPPQHSSGTHASVQEINPPAANGQSLRDLAPPLSTARLRPTRQKTKNAVCSILENGEVCLEFIKIRNKEDRITDVCRISSDGMRIVLYHPNEGKGVRVTESTPCLPEKGADFIYSYENLPNQHWKKYLYAERFVGLVKAKSPKITFYSNEAKCLLMENSPNPDFEANFFSGGKIVKTRTGYTITEPTGCTSNVPLDESYFSSSERLQEMFKHFKECHSHCSNLEAVLESLSRANKTFACFPVTIGKRPQVSAVSKSTPDKENRTVQVLSGLPSFETSGRSSTAPLKSLGQNSSTVRAVEVPSLGHVEKKVSGEVEITFLDGSRLAVAPSSDNVVYGSSATSRQMIFSTKEQLPEQVRVKLALVPKALDYLLRNSSRETATPLR